MSNLTPLLDALTLMYGVNHGDGAHLPATTRAVAL